MVVALATSATPNWHRRLYLRPDVDGWTVWQFTGRGSVDGVGGDVDVNVMRPG